MKRDLVEPAEETVVLGTFPDGQPAVTLAQHGRGHGLYIATQADAGYVETERPLLRPVLESVLHRLQISPEMRLDYPGHQRKLDPHLLREGNRDLIFIANYSPGRVEATLHLNRRAAEADIRRLWPNSTGDKLTWRSENDNVQLDLSFEQSKGGVFEVIWKL
jgi:hypothetical protein